MRVLISGAGIAGPTLAFWLARQGIHVTIVDIAHGIIAQGQNIDLCGAAVTIIKRMGLEQQLKALNTSEKGTHIVDKHGRVIAAFDGVDTGLSPTSPYEILRGDLAVLLGEATQDLPNVTYKFETRVEQVLSDDERSVQVELSDGEVADFDIVIAADGQWSGLRKRYFDQSTIGVVDMNIFVGYYTIPRTADDDDYWRVYWPLHGRVVNARPDSYGMIRVMLAIMPRTAEQKAAWESASRGTREARVALLKSEFRSADGQTSRYLNGLDEAKDLYLQSLKQIKMTKWSTGRIICLGDAAYAPTPLTGMGTSLAITGAYVLAGEISKLVAGDHPAKAFDAYEAKYKPFVEQSQTIWMNAPGMFFPTTAWHRWVMQTLLWVMSKILELPWLARLFADMKTAEERDGGFPMPAYAGLAK